MAAQQILNVTMTSVDITALAMRDINRMVKYAEILMSVPVRPNVMSMLPVLISQDPLLVCVIKAINGMESYAKGSSLTSFRIESKHIKDENSGERQISFITDVTIKVYDWVIELLPDRIVRVNGVRVTPPTFLLHRVTVLPKSSHVAVITDFGLEVLWNGMHSVEISIPASYKGAMQGLCGTYSLTEQSTRIEQPAAYFNQWALPDNDTDCENVDEESTAPVCDDTNHLQEAERRCNDIINGEGVFQDCHHVIDPTGFYDSCVFDTCAVMTDDELEYCESIEAYAEACRIAGVVLPYDYKIQTKCAKQCPEGQHYLTCGSPCPLTCGLTPDDLSCDHPYCEEGCYCIDESLYKESDRCIEKENCGCQKDGFYYPVIEIVPDIDCHQTCTCQPGGVITCEQIQACHTNATCSAENGEMGCHCITGYQGDGFDCTD
ncbi:alpha-tectorin-like [Amphiura filiformis]|uniref:alpha-tectorin-like n=1 Tax=Amphiura filiformis TaxID=82378 RepID=UPI003B21E051